MADFEKKETLITVEIDQAEAFKNVDRLTDAILNQQKAISSNNSEIKQLNKNNNDLSKEVKAGTKTQEQANKEIEANSQKINDLKKANLTLKDGLSDLNKERSNAVKVTKLQENSLNALRNKSAELKNELNNVNTSTEEGRKKFESLQKQLKKVNDQIVESDQGAGDFKTTIGRYRQEVGGAIKDSGGFGGAIGSVGGTVTQTGGRISQLFKLLLANPFIAIVALLAGLVKSFIDTQKGMDTLTSVTRPFFALFERLKGVVQDLALNSFERLKKALSDPKQAILDLGNAIKDNIIARFEALTLFAPAISKIFKGDILDGLKDLGNAAIQVGTGIEGAIDKIQQAARDTGDFINESIDEGKRLDELTKEIEKREIELIKNRASLREEFEKQKEIAQDLTNSEEDRIAAAQAAQAAQNELLNQEQKFIDLKIKRMQIEHSLNDTSREDEKELAELIARRTEFEAEAAKKRVSARSLENSIKKQLAAEEQKRLEDEKRQEEERIKLADEAAAKKLENQRVLDEKLQELADFKRERDNEIALEEAETDAEKFELMLEQEQERFDIREEQLAEQRAIALENESLSKEERLAIEAEYDLMFEELKARHEDNLTKIKEDADKVREDADKKQIDARLKRAKDEANKVAGVVNQGLGMLKQGSDAYYETRNNKLEAQHRKELNDLTTQLNIGQITRAEYDRKKEQLEKDSAKKAHELKVKQFKTNRTIALIEGAINTAQGVLNALGSFPPPASFIMAALVGVLGGIQIAAIASQQPPAASFAQGGDVHAFTVGGRYHSQGGTKYYGEDGNAFEVEKDEGIFVTKRSATNPALRALSDINQQHGGRSMFSTPKAYLQTGGAARGGSGMTAGDIEAITEAVGRNLPAPKVEVVDIMSGIEGNREANSTGVI